MKRFWIAMLIVSCLAVYAVALSPSAQDAASTFRNGYQWSGNAGDNATPWAQAVETAATGGSEALGTGKTFYVDSGAAASGNGTSWTQAKDTIEKAVQLCSSNRGDVIYVAQGHAESFTAEDLDVDIAGITIVGAGTGSLRPTITYAHANGEVAIGASNVTIKNIRFFSSIPDVLMGIEVEDGVDYFTISGCEFSVDTDGTDEFAEAINFVNANENCSIIGNVFNSKAGNSVAAIFLDADTDCLSIVGNDIRGDYSTACIVGDTAASTDILLLNNLIVNGALIGDGGLNTEPAIELLDSTAGIAQGNVFAADVATGLAIRVADDLCFIENWIADSDGDDKAGAMESTSATITVFVDGG